MSTDAENEAYFTARYAEARGIFPLLSYPTFTHNAAGAISCEELNVGGLAVFNLPPGFDVPAIDRDNHTVKHEAGHAYLRRLERTTGIPRTVYVENFRVRFGYPANYAVPNYTPGYVSLGEAWAEVFCNACEGRVVTSKSHLDEVVDPLAARSWFQLLSGVSPTPIPTPTPTFNLSIVWFPSPNFWQGRPLPIKYIVLHTTQGTDSRSWLTNPASQVSAHYLVRGTQVYQLVDEDNSAWHAGSVVGTPTTPLYTGANPNHESIGIEMEGFAALTLDAETLNTTAALIKDIRGRRGSLPLVNHAELSPGNRSDPGPHNRAAVEERLGVEDMTRDEVIALIEQKWGLTNTIAAMKAAYDPAVALAHPKSHKHDVTGATSEPK